MGQITLFLAIPLLFELIHWYAYVRHLNAPAKRKALYLTVDFIHNVIVFAAMVLLVTSAGNPRKVLLLNSLYLIFIIQFFIFKRCSLSVLHNKIIGREYEHNFVSHKDRLLYLLHGKYNIKKGSSTDDWMRWNLWHLIILFAVNMYTYFRIKT